MKFETKAGMSSFCFFMFCLKEVHHIVWNILNGELQLATLLIKVILNNIEEKAIVQKDTYFAKML